MATKPRQILPGRTWFVTGRALNRQHRFVPKDKVVEVLWYCLAVAAQKYKVQLHGFTWMSNHYHLVLTDASAQLPDFMRDLNSLISKSLNAIRGLRGQNFERSGYNAVVVADGARMLRHCAYTEANPCLAGLVERAVDWESVTSANLDYEQTVEVRRPKFGLWGPGDSSRSGENDPSRSMYCGRVTCPEVASFRLVRPPCLNGSSANATRVEVRKLVAELEGDARKKRSKARRPVLGMRRVKSFNFDAVPANSEDFFGGEPDVSGEDPDQRMVIKRGLREFFARYRQALDQYRRDGLAFFPEGTWWMKRCLNARCYAYCGSS